MAEREEATLIDTAAIDAQIDAQTNPYLMSQSFSATTVLVSQPLSGAANYIPWRRAMKIALSGKNKEGFIDGSITKPTNPKLVVPWKCNNDVITSWIINSVSKDIAASIIYSGSAKEIWDELAERFRESNGPRVYQLRKELVTMTQGTMSVEVYFTKLKTIWQDLGDFRPSCECSCGKLKPLIEHLNSEYMMVFLMGLNDSFSTLRMQILLMEPLPSINKVFSLVVQEERQRNIGGMTTVGSFDEPVILAAAESKRNSFQLV